MDGIAGLLPAASRDAGGPVSGRVFKIERGAAGEKIAYVRMFSGTVRARDRVRFGVHGERKVTAAGIAGPWCPSRFTGSAWMCPRERPARCCPR
jgi:translation elongation factor EF-G